MINLPDPLENELFEDYLNSLLEQYIDELKPHVIKCKALVKFR